MPALETRTEFFALKNQTGKGTVAATPGKRFRKVGGGLAVRREEGSENYSDGAQFPSSQPFINTLSGDGSPVFQGQAGAVGYLAWLISGAETVNASGSKFIHEAVPTGTDPWVTAWKSAGSSVAQRQRFADCRITTLRLEASQANKILKATSSLISLDPGESIAADPATALDTPEPLLFTEAEQAIKIGGSVVRGVASFVFTVSRATQLWYGDSVLPYEVVYGPSSVALEGITLLVDSAGLEIYNTEVYGTPNPVAGSKPSHFLQPDSSFEVDMRKGNLQTVTITGSPTGGTFTLTYASQTTAPIAYNATAAAVEDALAALSSLPDNEVSVSGGPGPATPYTVRFADPNATVVTGSGAGFTGGSSPDLTIGQLGPDEQVKITCPSAHLVLPDAPEGNPEGGPAEIALAATLRKPTVGEIYTITTKSSDPAYS